MKNLNNNRHVFYKYYLDLCQFHCLNPSPAIKQAIKCNELNLCGDRVRSEDWQLITKALSKDLSLESIYIWSRYCRVNPAFLKEGFKRKALVMRNIPPFLQPKIISSLISSLARCFQISKALTCLKLHFLPLLSHDTKLLAETIGSCSSLQHLSLSHSCLGDDACITLCKSLKDCSKLNTLNLAGCLITPVGANAVANLIKEHSSISSREVWSPTSHPANTEGTVNSDGLKRITLNQNPMIGDLGIDHLAMHLLDDVCLKAIDLQDCGISNIGGEIIKCVLQVNRALQIVDLRFNDLDCIIFDEILSMLVLNNRISPVQWQWTKIDPFISSKYQNSSDWSEYDQQHPLCKLNIIQNLTSIEKSKNHQHSMRNKTPSIEPGFYKQRTTQAVENALREPNGELIMVEKTILMEINSTLQKINLFIHRLNLPQLIAILREIKAQTEKYETQTFPDSKIVNDTERKGSDREENCSDDSYGMNMNEIFKRKLEKTLSLDSSSKKCSCCDKLSDQFQSDDLLKNKSTKKVKANSETSEDFSDLFKVLRKFSSAFYVQNSNSPVLS
nr:PREDICTED: centrosomal protein of 78 kDa-like [Bemisia tabaci]